jgi:hypothetical protein
VKSSEVSPLGNHVFEFCLTVVRADPTRVWSIQIDSLKGDREESENAETENIEGH